MVVEYLKEFVLITNSSLKNYENNGIYY